MLSNWFPPIRGAVFFLALSALVGPISGVLGAIRKQVGYASYALPFSVQNSDGLWICAHDAVISGATSCIKVYGPMETN